MTHAPNTGIEELYRSVIQDVIEQSKEAFLDENVDEHILIQIQKAWEEKINASGAADLNKKESPVPTVRPVPVKPQPSSTKSGSSASRAAAASAAPTMVTQENPTSSSTSQAQIQNPQYVTAAELPIFRNSDGVQLQGFPYLPNNLGQFVVSGNPGVMLLPVELQGNANGPNVIQLTQEQLNQLPQNDGESCILEIDEIDVTSVFKPKTKKKEKSKSISMKNLKIKDIPEQPAKKIIPQLDGGPHMSDSSSDDDEDDDDPLSRMVNRIDDKEDEGDDDGGDEDPLNSADDQSDDEDLDTLFESSNIIVCQFEKVNRARNKWKFTLKDGIMHLDGKDFCFQKCTGEAECMNAESPSNNLAKLCPPKFWD